MRFCGQEVYKLLLSRHVACSSIKSENAVTFPHMVVPPSPEQV